MADDQENRSTDDLSEEASPYRIQEMRRQGKVAQSRELAGLFALLAAAGTLYGLSGSMQSQIFEFMRESFRLDSIAKIDFAKPGYAQTILFNSARICIMLGLPVMIAGFLAGILGSFAQVGTLFSSDPLVPDLQRIDPFQGAKRLFSMKQVVELLRLLLKGGAITYVAYGMLSAGFERNISQIFGTPEMTLHALAQHGRDLFFSLFGVLFAFAGIDYWLQKRDFSKNIRLTKQEAKQEHREHEGDPQIKARIRSIQRETARKRMMQAVKKADVIVTNPTHIAIALVYDKEKMSAPKVVAKGADLIAQKIKKIAEDAGIPMVENVPLARALFKSVKIGQSVPRVLYQAIAEVLAYVYRLKSKRNGGGRE